VASGPDALRLRTAQRFELHPGRVAAVTAIKAGNYAEALAKLQTLAGQVKPTPEQQQAIQDVIAQVQKQLTAQAEKMQKDAGKAVGDLQKSLSK
jgi:cytochrome c-type biogenesis protein CcmH/NrfG